MRTIHITFSGPLAALFITALLVSACAVEAEQESASLHLERLDDREPQNIVFILSDDHAYNNMSFMGHDFVETPHMDAMAENGVTMMNAMVTTSLCSPSRASILTGQYSFQHGVVDNNTLVPEGTVFFPEYLQEASYNTAFVGKWHMGAHTDEPRPGFDHWVSFPGQGSYTPEDQTLNVNGEHADRTDYMTDELTDYALEWLAEQRDADEPFMLYLSHKAVHSNFTPAERHRDRYADVEIDWPETMHFTAEQAEQKPMWLRNQRNSWHGVDFPYHSDLDLDHFYKRYNETILALDDSVGEVIAFLEEQGMMENTVVIYMSDQGFHFGEQGLIDKRVAYEPSIRTPLLLYAPGRFEAGIEVDQVVANIDIAPTLLELAGMQKPDHMQGRSFLPLALQEDVEWDRDYLLYAYYWERNFPHTPTMFALRGDRYKYIHYYGLWDTHELYDLQEDPEEAYNLIRESEDHEEIAESMREELFDMLEELEGDQIPLRRPRGGQQNMRSADGSEGAPFPSYFIRD